MENVVFQEELGGLIPSERRVRYPLTGKYLHWWFFFHNSVAVFESKLFKTWGSCG